MRAAALVLAMIMPAPARAGECRKWVFFADPAADAFMEAGTG